MPEDFVMKNVGKEVESAINNAQSASELREAMLQALEKTGRIVRPHNDAFNFKIQQSSVPRPPVVPLSMTPAVENYSRIIYPHGNDRYEIFGASEADLDEKERQLRSMYGQQ